MKVRLSTRTAALYFFTVCFKVKFTGLVLVQMLMSVRHLGPALRHVPTHAGVTNVRVLMAMLLIGIRKLVVLWVSGNCTNIRWFYSIKV